MYKLNKDSKSSKFYSWLWTTDVTTFKSMCPYFWSWVLTIIFLPIVLPCRVLFYFVPWKKSLSKVGDKIAEVKAVQYTGEKVSKVFEVVTSQTRFWDIIGKGLKYLYFTIIGVFLLGVVIMLGYGMIFKTLEVFTVMGAATILCLIIFGAISLGENTQFFESIWKPFKFIGNMAYNTYKNICPLVVWEDKNK